MRLLDRFAAPLLLAVLLTSCTSTQEGQDGGSETTELPRLIDLGSTQCTPCKRMAPILERLKQDYAGIVAVEFIDIRKDAAAGMVHGVRVIPTQIFLDRSGSEVFRHEGFFSREEIESVFRDSLGVEIVARTDVDDAMAPVGEDSTETEVDAEEFLIEGAM